MISIYHMVSITILTVILGLNIYDRGSSDKNYVAPSSYLPVMQFEDVSLKKEYSGLPTEVLETQTDKIATFKLSSKQKKLLEIAKIEGDKIGFPETIQAILLQETLAGILGPVGDKGNGFGKRSYCHMQIKVDSARNVLKEYPDLGTWETNEELIAELLTNDEFCIKIGSLYFSLLFETTNNWNKAVLAYNRGLRGSKLGDINNYVRNIKQKIKGIVRPFNNVYMPQDQQVATNQ